MVAYRFEASWLKVLDLNILLWRFWIWIFFFEGSGFEDSWLKVLDLNPFYLEVSVFDGCGFEGSSFFCIRFEGPILHLCSVCKSWRFYFRLGIISSQLFLVALNFQADILFIFSFLVFYSLQLYSVKKK